MDQNVQLLSSSKELKETKDKVKELELSNTSLRKQLIDLERKYFKEKSKLNEKNNIVLLKVSKEKEEEVINELVEIDLSGDWRGEEDGSGLIDEILKENGKNFVDLALLEKTKRMEVETEIAKREKVCLEKENFELKQKLKEKEEEMKTVLTFAEDEVKIKKLEEEIELLNQSLKEKNKEIKNFKKIVSEKEEKIKQREKELENVLKKNEYLCLDLKKLEKMVSELDRMRIDEINKEKFKKNNKNDNTQLITELRLKNTNLQTELGRCKTELLALKRKKQENGKNNEKKKDFVEEGDEGGVLLKELVESETKELKTELNFVKKELQRQKESFKRLKEKYDSEVLKKERAEDEEEDIFSRVEEICVNDNEDLINKLEEELKEKNRIIEELQKAPVNLHDDFAVQTEGGFNNNYDGFSGEIVNFEASIVDKEEEGIQTSLVDYDDVGIQTSKFYSEQRPDTIEEREMFDSGVQTEFVPASEEIEEQVNNLMDQIVQLNQIKSEYEEVIKNHEIEIKTIIIEFDTERDQLLRQLDEKCETIDMLSKQDLLVRKEEEIDNFMGMVDEYKEKVGDLEIELRNERVKGEMYVDRIQKMSEDAKMKVGEIQGLRAELEAVRVERIKLKQEVEMGEINNRHLDEIVDKRGEELRKCLDDLGRVRKDLENLKLFVSKKDDEILELNEEINSMKDKLQVVEYEKDVRKEELHKMNQQYGFLEDALKEERNRNVRIQMELRDVLGKSKIDIDTSIGGLEEIKKDKYTSVSGLVDLKSTGVETSYSDFKNITTDDVLMVNNRVNGAQNENLKEISGLRTKEIQAEKKQTPTYEKKAAINNKKIDIGSTKSISAASRMENALQKSSQTHEVNEKRSRSKSDDKVLDKNFSSDTKKTSPKASPTKMNLQPSSTRVSPESKKTEQDKQEKIFTHKEVKFEDERNKLKTQNDYQTPLKSGNQSELTTSGSRSEKKVLDELENTKQQLKQFEKLITEKTKAIFENSTRGPINNNLIPEIKNSPSGSGTDDNVTKEVLKAWKKQNQAMREELLNMINNSLSSPPSEYNAKSRRDLNSDTSKFEYDKISSVKSSHLKFNTISSTTQSSMKDTFNKSNSAGGGFFVTPPVESSPIKVDDRFRKSLDESERRRKMLEEENRTIMTVVREVSDDLKLAKLISPSASVKSA